MFDDINVQRQCQTCLASFPTNEILRAHLDAYKTGERILSSQIEYCRAHKTPVCDLERLSHSNDDTNSDAIEERIATIHDAIGIARKCPYEDCGKTFNTRRALLRHFEQHVPCSEICVYCFRRLPYVSVFIKHVKSHNYANERKNRYLSGMCDDLREQAATELDRMIAALTTSRGSDEVRPAKKRRVSDESKQITTSAQKETHPLLDQVVMPSDLTIGSHATEPPVRHVQTPPFAPTLDSVDLFAPPLFGDYGLLSVNDFDAPLFGAFPSPINNTGND